MASAATAQAEVDRCKNVAANGIWQSISSQSDAQSSSVFQRLNQSKNPGSSSL
jgi:hypothetical protein